MLLSWILAHIAYRRKFPITFIWIVFLSTVLSGCGAKNVKPVTLAESVSGYTYIPIDPTTVHIEPGECEVGYSDFGDDQEKHRVKLLSVLPDNAVRMSMELSDSTGRISYGISKIGSAGSNYKLTADYVNSDTVNKSVFIKKTMDFDITEANGHLTMVQQTTRREHLSASVTRSSTFSGTWLGPFNGETLTPVPGTEKYDVRTVGREDKTQIETLLKQDFQEFSVPVYVGVGLRIVAEGISITNDASISGIGVIGLEADAKHLSGSLTIQTLGVNSQAVASALPVQSELSRTSAENAFVAIGSIKAMLHQKETIKFPRVVGLYLPFPGGKPLVNALIAELSRNPVRWCPNGFAIPK